MSQVTMLFGIPNCDTIKKAKKWLSENDINYQFHDYRKDGIDQSWLNDAVEKLGWESVLNKRGTTFRQLSEQQKANLSAESAIELMLERPAMIKRPILSHKGELHLGFKANQYTEIFN